MKKIYALLMILALAGCGKKESIQMIPGPQGAAGPQGPVGATGANGHSLVSQFLSVDVGSLECANGGNRLDIYLDMDDNLELSESDSYQGSLVSCNGLNGLDGIAGLDGTNGADGAQGPQGIPGAQGPQGEAGPQGLAGSPGAPGEQGEAGPTGPAGPQGPQGTVGAQGPAGAGATITAYTSSSCTAITGSSYYVKTNGSGGSLYTGSTCASNTKVIDLSNGSSFWVSTNMLALDYSTLGIKVVKFN